MCFNDAKAASSQTAFETSLLLFFNNYVGRNNKKYLEGNFCAVSSFYSANLVRGPKLHIGEREEGRVKIV